jgi:hypothetical protein
MLAHRSGNIRGWLSALRTGRRNKRDCCFSANAAGGIGKSMSYLRRPFVVGHDKNAFAPSGSRAGFDHF